MIFYFALLFTELKFHIPLNTVCELAQNGVHLHCFQWTLTKDLKLCDYAIHME